MKCLKKLQKRINDLKTQTIHYSLWNFGINDGSQHLFKLVGSYTIFLSRWFSLFDDNNLVEPWLSWSNQLWITLKGRFVIFRSGSTKLGIRNHLIRHSILMISCGFVFKSLNEKINIYFCWWKKNLSFFSQLAV